ncbi:MAG: hypothetical protein AB1801_04850 [Chloroflexota bacterium]
MDSTGKSIVDHTVRINQPNEQIIPELIQALERQELHAILTFDFQHARSPHVSCGCPHHGTEACNCQYAVLLVYNPQHGYEVYRTLTIHGRDEQVWLSLLKRPASPRQIGPAHEALETKLLEILFSLAAPSQTEDAEAGEPIPSTVKLDGKTGRLNFRK